MKKIDQIPGVLWLACLSFTLSCPLAGLSGAPAPDPSLKLHFNFDEDFSSGKVRDVTGNGHDGWQFCPTNWISATNGVFGTRGALWHTNDTGTDGTTLYMTSQYIGVTNLAGIEYLTNGTISFWAQFGQGSGLFTVMLDAGYPVPYAVYPDRATNSWNLGRIYAAYLSFSVFDASAYRRTIVNWPTDVVRPGGYTPDLSTTRYHLYTLAFSCASNQAIAYYDGRPYMTNTIGVPWLHIYSSTPWLAIGCMSHDGTPQWGDDMYPNSGFFDGKMDDLRIYDRALSSVEVQGLYFGGDARSRDVNLQKADAQSVRLSWTGQSNTTYQVEYSQDLASNGWISLGAPILSGDGTNAIFESLQGRPMRFYRILAVP